MLGWVFLETTSTKQRKKCLALGHNAVPSVRFEPATLDPESRTLPLSHRAPLNTMNGVWNTGRCAVVYCSIINL